MVALLWILAGYIGWFLLLTAADYWQRHRIEKRRPTGR